MSYANAVGKAKRKRDEVQLENISSAHRRGYIVLVSLGFLLVAVCLLSGGIGAVEISPGQATAIMLGEVGIDIGI